MKSRCKIFRDGACHRPRCIAAAFDSGLRRGLSKTALEFLSRRYI
jgi:hypothetical protein